MANVFTRYEGRFRHSDTTDTNKKTNKPAGHCGGYFSYHFLGKFPGNPQFARILICKDQQLYQHSAASFERRYLRVAAALQYGRAIPPATTRGLWIYLST